ncbi:MAG: aminopeptidase P N-terminal domain-containing protein [Candidatus Aminicenantes bacterium]|nr:aminopeptidase P N-terminal domain-containing protein [Candidatus Aminicenantes bacterium]
MTRSLSACVLALAMATAAPVDPPLDFDASEYSARRQKLMAQIPDGFAVIQGSLAGPLNNEFIQNNEFIYLCGVKLPRAVLIVDGIHKESLLLYSASEAYLRNEGLSLDLLRDPRGATGVEKYYPADELTAVLTKLAAQAKVIYTPLTPEGSPQEVATNSDWDGRLTREHQLAAMLRQRFPDIEVRDCTHTLWDLRRIKTPAEVDVLRKASQISVQAMREVMAEARVGQYEYEISALFEYVCKRRGCRRVFDYNVIISSAENHPYLHYYRHNRRLVDGDFLVVDSGGDYRDYDSDITISFPVNGTFSPRQREIYEACNAVSKACLLYYQPGVTAYEVGEQVRRKLRDQGYDLSRDAFTSLRYFKEGGVTHYVGLATHDAGGSDKPKDRPLRAGEVFASDVFAVFPKENLGVRIENIVLITETGCENLSAGLPREISEIEALMKGARK